MRFDEVAIVHDFMATGKVLGEENNHVFLNKPVGGVKPLEWFWRKMNELKVRADDGLIELTFRNLIGLVLPESLGFNWKFRYDWHMETVRVVLSPRLLELLCDWDYLKELDSRYGLENSKSAGGVNLMESLLPILLELAAKDEDDGLSVVVEHRLAIPGRSGQDGRIHKIDQRDDLDDGFLNGFAHGFSSELVEGIMWRVGRLKSGKGKYIVV